MTHLLRQWRKTDFDYGYDTVDGKHALQDKIKCKKCGWRVELNEPHVMTNYEQTKNTFSYYHKWCWQKNA